MAHPLAVALAGYAARVHAWAGDGHHVVSPLAAWLVLALVAPLAAGDDRGRLEDVLGVDAETAAGAAAALLDDPHPLVAAAAGAWARPSALTARLSDWIDGLPGSVATGNIPTRAELDAWADKATLGLIRSFPVDRVDRVVALLATAVATRVSWERTYQVVGAGELEPSAWPGRVRRVLRASGGAAGGDYLVDTDEAGRCGVHASRAAGGLVVVSVIAADARVPAVSVLAAAERIAAWEAAGAGRRPPIDEAGAGRPVSLFDLPLGADGIWTISERAVRSTGRPRLESRYVTVLPAWKASSELSLGVAGLGFDVAGRIVGAATAGGPGPVSSRQAVLARYGPAGFEAAAATTLYVGVSRPPDPRGRRRIATIRFAHPFAAVAAVCPDRQGANGGAGAAWAGLPVFSAWVAEPVDADEVADAGRPPLAGGGAHRS